MIDKIIILKSERKLLLMVGDKAKYKFDIDLGTCPVGKKRFEGDKKTPEGKYKIAYKNDKSNYYLGLKISYPDFWDRIYAWLHFRKPGGQIMIHGQTTNKGFESYKKFQSGEYKSGMDWTWGCIAMRNNKDMRKIWNLITIGTKIEIKK